MDISNLWSGYDLNSKKQNSRCLSVNTILEGKYLVGPVLGQGGFGITYVGYDLNMESKIAIKEYFPVELVSRDTTTIHGDHVLSLSGEKSIAYKTGLKKYVAEAQNVSQFSEVPGVASVKDFFYANETAYIVMEFIDGISLKDYLKEKGGRLTEEQTLAIMKPILEALVQVHKSGIIHRDISPDNIMLVRNAAGQITQVKLIDFGAARMTEKNDQKSLTIILKHGYAPEEQYRTHGEQGPWTDVYALCAVFYRMLTGDTPVSAMDRLFKDELKSFEQCGAKVSNNTAATILKGLAVKMDDRIQSVQELIKVLYEGGKVKASASKSNKGILAAWISAAVVLAIGGTALFFSGNASKGTVSNPEDNVSESVIIAVEKETNTTETEKDTESTEKTECTENLLDILDTEEQLGEQIAYYSSQNSMDYFRHLLICKPDGTVMAVGENSNGQCQVEDWEYIVAVQTGSAHSLGLRQDGTVVAAGDNGRGQCDVEHWTDVVQICAIMSCSFGVTKDGNILIAGEFTRNNINLSEIGSWTDIRLFTGTNLGVFAGVKTDGSVVCEGMEIQTEITGWDNVEFVFFAGENHLDGEYLIGIESDGTVRYINIINGTGGIIHNSETSIPAMQQLFVADEESWLGITKEGLLNCSKEYVCPDECRDWSELMAVAVLDEIWYGLQSDGTILEYYPNIGNAQLEDFINIRWAKVLTSADMTVTQGVIAQTLDGKILYYGTNRAVVELIDCIEKDRKVTDGIEWPEEIIVLEEGTVYTENQRIRTENVKQIVPIEVATSMYLCLLQDGTVEIVYPEYWNCTEREAVDLWKNVTKICSGYSSYWGLQKTGSILMQRIETWGEEIGLESVEVQVKGNDFVDIDCNDSNTCIAVKADGTTEVITGSDEGNGNLQVDTWSNITQIALGESHTVGLRSDGTVIAVGSNYRGQCDVEKWQNVVYIDACGCCTIGITAEGEFLLAGSLY